MKIEVEVATNPSDVAVAVQTFESRFLVRNKDGICVDWMAASKDQTAFAVYICNRQTLRTFAKGRQADLRAREAGRIR